MQTDGHLILSIVAQPRISEEVSFEDLVGSKGLLQRLAGGTCAYVAVSEETDARQTVRLFVKRHGREL